MNGNIGWIIVLLIGLMGTGGLITAQITRSQQLLTKWATENGYQVLQAQVRPLFNKGPFFWSSKAQVVYRIVVQDEQGYERSGWLQLGSPFIGVLSDRANVRWDE